MALILSKNLTLHLVLEEKDKAINNMEWPKMSYTESVPKMLKRHFLGQLDLNIENLSDLTKTKI